MDQHIFCPRCGARDSFMKGFLPETCACRVCQSQLDWREIPGCGPDCEPRNDEPETGTASGGIAAETAPGGTAEPAAE